MIRALIAGRTRVHREALAVALSQARGVRVLGTASHREEILTRLAEAPPDIVLVDFVMPEAASIVAEIRRRTPSVCGLPASRRSGAKHSREPLASLSSRRRRRATFAARLHSPGAPQICSKETIGPDLRFPA